MFSSGYVDLFRVMPSRLVPRFLPGSGKFGSLEHARSTALQIVLHPKNRARRATILRALDFQTQNLRTYLGGDGWRLCAVRASNFLVHQWLHKSVGVRQRKWMVGVAYGCS